MLRTNLSTRPFYNIRAVQAVLGTLAALVLAITVFNVFQGLRLSSSQRTLGARAAAAEAEAARLRTEAAAIRAQINPRELATVAEAAREANGIIDRRAFSWTGLFAQFEATLPDDVRITAVQPRLEDDGSFVVGVRLESRREEDLDAFVEALENESTFRNVLPIETRTMEDGLIEAVVEGTYVPPAREAVAAQSAPSAPAGSMAPASAGGRRD